MAQHVIKGHIYWQQNQYMKKPKIRFDEYDMRTWSPDNRDGRVWIAEHQFTVDVPDDFDPRPSQIAAIEAEITDVRAKFTARITELQEQKSRLLALENTVDA